MCLFGVGLLRPSSPLFFPLRPRSPKTGGKSITGLQGASAGAYLHTMATKVSRGDGTVKAYPMGKIVAFCPKGSGAPGAYPKNRGAASLPLSFQRVPQPPQHRPPQRTEANHPHLESPLAAWMRDLGFPPSRTAEMCARVRMVASAGLQGAHRKRVLARVAAVIEKEAPHNPSCT